jgi:hypothetical protein
MPTHTSEVRGKNLMRSSNQNTLLKLKQAIEFGETICQLFQGMDKPDNLNPPVQNAIQPDIIKGTYF